MLLNKKILKYKRILLFKWGMLLFMLFEKPIFKKIGKHISIGKDYTFVNHNYISIGNMLGKAENRSYRQVWDSIF